MAAPFLRRNPRLADGIDERLLKISPPAADLWIQAASAGEANLAGHLIEHLNPVGPLKILITTNTRQGRDILEKAVARASENNPNLAVRCAFFPFDRPGLMRLAVRLIHPRLVVLLETELWPGLLRALKQAGAKVFIINGRLTDKSARRYKRFPKICQALKPDGILAISPLDAERYAAVFNMPDVTVVPNIKFDLIRFEPQPDLTGGALSTILADQRLVVLGSIRQEEEADILSLIGWLLDRHPEITIALCPRHMHRLDALCEMLSAAGRHWVLRSRIAPRIDAGKVIVWDRFGELNLAYSLSCATFVGGSLAPLGGQNFLEPLAFGIRPVIGPHWKNFAWVGRDIVEKGLVRQVADWRKAGACLSAQLKQPDDKAQTMSEALTYIQSRQGGTQSACGVIENQLK